MIVRHHPECTQSLFRGRCSEMDIRCHCIAESCVALRCVALRCVALRCVALRCVALRCVALRCVALRCVALRCVALRCVALRCVALHCIADVNAVVQTSGVRVRDRSVAGGVFGGKNGTL